MNSNYEIEKIEEKEKKINSIGIELDGTLLKNIPSSSKKYTKIQLIDLFNEKNKYNNKCFCYLVVSENILIEFYKWWC